MPGTSGTSVRHSTTDVLVVGAGPVGLLLAAELARRGVDCRIVEQATARRSTPKAINLHTRTLEILDDMGIADDAVGLGNRVCRLNSYAVRGSPAGRVKSITRVDLTGLDSRFPFTLTLAQPETESLLERRCADYGVKVEWGTRLESLTQDDGFVIAFLGHGVDGKKEAVRAAWLVGCDGIDSTVRNCVGLPFEGMQYPNDLVCADVRIDWGRPHDEAHVFLSRHGTVRCMPLPGDGRWRVVADVPPGSRGSGLAEFDLEQLRSLADARGVAASLDEMTWSSRFSIYRYFAPRYRVGRVLLAGDAAHVHSPLGAQGMNLGLQDSYNLAWKLTLAQRGASRPELLGSYEAERRAIAAQVLRRTDRNTRLIAARGALAQGTRNTAARLLLRLPAAQRRLGRDGAQLSMNYRHSPLAVDDVRTRRLLRDGGPAAGDRAPDTEFGPAASRRRCHEILHGTGYVLLFFLGKATSGGTAAAVGIAEQVRAHASDIRMLAVMASPEAAPASLSMLLDPGGELHKSWHAAPGSAYLVRPDGYIGYRAAPATAAGISRYLDSVFDSPDGGRRGQDR